MDFPQTILDQLADPTVTTLNFPNGNFELPPTKALYFIRPNLTVNAGSCNLHVDPALRSRPGGGYTPGAEINLIVVKSLPTTHIWAVSPLGKVKRTMSHLTGKIVPGTYQLTMVPTEICDVLPGEMVVIWAGVQVTDPYEPHTHFVMTVQSVDYATGVITFAKPFGEVVPDYVCHEYYKTLVVSTQQYKIGAWGTLSESNWSKGFGTDHGMVRFIGGMTSNVVINGLRLDLESPTRTTAVNGGDIVVMHNAANIKFNSPKVTNPYGSVFFSRQAWNLIVNDADVSGDGLCMVYNTMTQAGALFDSWGGDGAVFNRCKVHGKNIIAATTQVGASGNIFDSLNYDVEFTDARDIQGAVFLWTAMKDRPVFRGNCRVKTTLTSGPRAEYFSHQPHIFDGKFEFVGSSLRDIWDFGAYKFPRFDGTIVINGIEYGPPTMVQPVITIPYQPNNGRYQLTLPKGLYIPTCRFRVKTPGNLRGITDNRSGTYNYGPNAAHLPENLNKWYPFFAPGWHGIRAGDAGLAAYLDNQIFNFWFTASPQKLDAVVELNYTYLPQNVV